MCGDLIDDCFAMSFWATLPLEVENGGVMVMGMVLELELTDPALVYMKRGIGVVGLGYGLSTDEVGWRFGYGNHEMHRERPGGQMGMYEKLRMRYRPCMDDHLKSL